MSRFHSLGENDNFISLRISELKKTSHYKINTSIMLVSLQNPHVPVHIHSCKYEWQVKTGSRDQDCTANYSQLFPLQAQSVTGTFSVCLENFSDSM